MNCNHPNSRLARNKDSNAVKRTQSSIAVSLDKKKWFILNASPDLRQQLWENPELMPADSDPLRYSPIMGVFLTNADVPKELKEKLEIEGGAQVSEIVNGKWKSSGITKGFIVTSINKRSISDVEDLSTTLSQLPKDDGVLVEGVYPNGVKAYYGIGW